MVHNEKAKVDIKFDDVADILPGKENICIKGKIHVIVTKQLIYMFDSKLGESQRYEMSYFSVFPLSGFYRTTLYPYKLCSKLRQREYVRDDKMTKMVIVELTYHNGKCECGLIGDYVDDLNKKMGKSMTGLPIVVVQFVKVKFFRDNLEVESFKNVIVVHGIESDTIVPLIGERVKHPLDEEFLRMYPMKFIAELGKLFEDGMFVVCVEVVGIVDAHDWLYLACKCHKRVIPDSDVYFCSANTTWVVYFEVTDGKTTCVFLLFDSEMSYMIEKSCAFFVAQSKAVVSDGSYRVKKVCMNPTIIEAFCSEGGFFTPSKIHDPVKR
ncbi:uncharacterized protein LOC123904082 [Trifolium pratense]|uniref:uncharacterized protein LOC123904082 n=1 Tax=Trifolium pratense TaxID=57577 RepID=UPI001E691395|nr:uncharacterized protein LOC123904082 [Trifolium pratense]